MQTAKIFLKIESRIIGQGFDDCPLISNVSIEVLVYYRV